MLATDFDGQARDFLWKNLETARVDSLQRLRDEDIETAYVDLYAFSECLRPLPGHDRQAQIS